MIHKYAGISLLIVIQTLTVGDHIPDVFMIFLNPPFLPGRVRIAVKDLCADSTIFITFQPFWKLKFHTIIGQDDREQFLKYPNSEFFCQIIKNFYDLILRFLLQHKDKHKGTVTEKEGKEGLGTVIPSAFDRIEFDNRNVRILLNEFLKILVGPSYTEFLCSQADPCTGFSWLAFVTYLTAQIDVLSSKNALVYIIVECLPGTGNLVSVKGINVFQ